MSGFTMKKGLKVSCRLPLLLAVVFILFTNATITQATNVSIAEIEDCLNNDGRLKCETKKVISIDVSYGIQTKLETVRMFTIWKDGEPIEIEETLNIEIEKTMPTYIYPLRHFHTIPYFPYEEVIKVPDTLGGIDSDDAENPTAGWTYNGSNKIPYSQGFWVSKLFDPFYNDSFWRGEKILAEKATAENPFSTVHAMRRGELYFHGYELGRPVKYYEVKFTIKKGEEELTFTLTPNNPYFRIDRGGDGFQLKSELVGDKAEYAAIPDLSNQILYIPSSPDTHPFVQDYPHNMLLVPREEVTKDGTELDKAGVGFYAFRKLMGSGNARVLEAGDGLGNQLFHKHNSDLQKLIMNPDAETEYMVHGKKDFKGSMEFNAGMKKYLEYKVPEISNTEVSLVMVAETVKVMNTESIGVIEDAWVKSFNSMTKEGTLVVQISNWGGLKTDYVVSVTNRNMNIIEAIPAQARILGPSEEAEFEFDIKTAYNLDTKNEVLVSLKSPTGRLYDSIVVEFDTFKHHSKYSWDLRQKNEGSQVGTSSVDPNDVTAPVITLNGADDAMVIVTGSVYVEPGATATDNVDGVEPAVVGGDAVNGNVAGIYVVTYDKTDSSGNAAKQVTRVVIVRGNPEQDTTAPQLLLSATPTTLWPANGKMVEINVTMIASDDVDPNPVVTLLGIELSAGSEDNDVEKLSDGLIRLRASNDASEAGRTYKLTYRVTDDNGNSAEESITITVPHDKSQL